MNIWVDADACPAVIKEILFRAARRIGVMLTLVANHPLRFPPSVHICLVQVPQGADAADREIVRQLRTGDLVITADIPLAAQVIAKGGYALDPRGEFYDADNIGERLRMRDFMDRLRGCGIDTGGPSSLTQRDRQDFANRLDQFLTRYGKQG